MLTAQDGRQPRDRRVITHVNAHSARRDTVYVKAHSACHDIIYVESPQSAAISLSQRQRARRRPLKIGGLAERHAVAEGRMGNRQRLGVKLQTRR